MFQEEEIKEEKRSRSSEQIYMDLRKLYPVNNKPNYNLDERKTEYLR